jgi:lipopolysaccharide/colanic/teichoic acid biosynthesis glycosyltransferase
MSRLPEKERLELMHELEKRYSSPQSSWILKRKKFAWALVVKGAHFLKRFIDIGVSLAFLVALSPLLLIVMLLVKMDGGPVFYIAKRVGKFGQEFNFPKFRTMVPNADKIKQTLKSDQETSKWFKMKNDPRITKLGRFLRKSSIDELPQLWTVLKGDMSLVGPRPPLPNEVALYSLEDRRKLDITPGITGLWQVSGRSDIAFPDQVRLDVAYIESQSVWLDLIILLKTIPAVIFGKGAY